MQSKPFVIMSVIKDIEYGRSADSVVVEEAYNNSVGKRLIPLEIASLIEVYTQMTIPSMCEAAVPVNCDRAGIMNADTHADLVRQSCALA